MRSVVFPAIGILLLAGAAQAASIGIFSDSNCSSCNLPLSPGATGRLYINAQVDDLQPNAPNGAEFRIVGLPAGWTAQSTPNPAAFLVLGDPFGAGANISFFSGQPGACVNLFVVDVTATSGVSDVVLSVTAHQDPSNSGFQCPRLSMDWTPVFPLICVDGGIAFINSGQDCAVSTQRSTWTALKRLYTGEFESR